MSVLKSVLACTSIAGFLIVSAPAAVAHGGTEFYAGPSGARIYYETGQYYDRHQHRQSYRYPSDWQNYGYQRSWYRTHPNWYRSDHRDWYRDRHH